MITLDQKKDILVQAKCLAEKARQEIPMLLYNCDHENNLNKAVSLFKELSTSLNTVVNSLVDQSSGIRHHTKVESDILFNTISTIHTIQWWLKNNHRSMSLFIDPLIEIERAAIKLCVSGVTTDLDSKIDFPEDNQIANIYNAVGYDKALDYINLTFKLSLLIKTPADISWVHIALSGWDDVKRYFAGAKLDDGLRLLEKVLEHVQANFNRRLLFGVALENFSFDSCFNLSYAAKNISRIQRAVGNISAQPDILASVRERLATLEESLQQLHQVIGNDPVPLNLSELNFHFVDNQTLEEASRLRDKQKTRVAIDRFKELTQAERDQLLRLIKEPPEGGFSLYLEAYRALKTQDRDKLAELTPKFNEKPIVPSIRLSYTHAGRGIHPRDTFKYIFEVCLSREKNEGKLSSFIATLDKINQQLLKDSERFVIHESDAITTVINTPKDPLDFLRRRIGLERNALATLIDSAALVSLKGNTLIILSADKRFTLKIDNLFMRMEADLTGASSIIEQEARKKAWTMLLELNLTDGRSLATALMSRGIPLYRWLPECGLAEWRPAVSEIRYAKKKLSDIYPNSSDRRSERYQRLSATVNFLRQEGFIALERGLKALTSNYYSDLNTNSELTAFLADINYMFPNLNLTLEVTSLTGQAVRIPLPARSPEGVYQSRVSIDTWGSSLRLVPQSGFYWQDSQTESASAQKLLLLEMGFTPIFPDLKKDSFRELDTFEPDEWELILKGWHYLPGFYLTEKDGVTSEHIFLARFGTDHRDIEIFSFLGSRKTIKSPVLANSQAAYSANCVRSGGAMSLVNSEKINRVFGWIGVRDFIIQLSSKLQTTN